MVANGLVDDAGYIYLTLNDLDMTARDAVTLRDFILTLSDLEMTIGDNVNLRNFTLTLYDLGITRRVTEMRF